MGFFILASVFLLHSIEYAKSLEKTAEITRLVRNDSQLQVSSTFNLTEVVGLGLRYHHLIFPKSCDAQGNVVVTGCSNTRPRFAACRCGSDCVKYADCCNLLPLSELWSTTSRQQASSMSKINASFDDQVGIGVYSHYDENAVKKSVRFDAKTLELSRGNSHAKNNIMSDDLADNNRRDFKSLYGYALHQPFFICFAISKWKTVYIVATCPPRQMRSNCSEEEQEKPHANEDISNVTGNAADCSTELENIDTRNLCESCLSNAENISLVTSHLTGYTYCNQYCLQCNERRRMDEHDLQWQREKTCRAIRLRQARSSANEILHQHQNETKGFASALNYQPGSFEYDNTSQVSTIENYDTGNHSNKSKLGTQISETKRTSQTEGERLSVITSNTGTPTPEVSLKTECNVKYHAPDGVHQQKCDFRLKDPMVETCDMNAAQQVFQETENHTLLELERLCSNVWAPVYDETNVYRNIFCFICQGQEPTKCIQTRQYNAPEERNPIFEVSITLLTDLDGKSISVSTVEKSLGGDTSEDQFLENSTFPCAHGFWEDPITVRCRKINCSPGRDLSADQSRCLVAGIKQENLNDSIGKGRERDSVIEAEEQNLPSAKGQNVYVLNLLWSTGAPKTSLGEDSTIVKEVVVKDAADSMDGTNAVNLEYEEVFTSDVQKISHKIFETHLNTRVASQSDLSFKPSVKWNDKEVILDFKTNLNKDGLFPRYNKEESGSLNGYDILERQHASPHSKSQPTQCPLLCQAISGIYCFGNTYPESCEKRRNQRGCWLTILRNAIFTFRSGLCEPRTREFIKATGLRGDNVPLNEAEGKQQHQSNPEGEKETLSKGVHTYIASAMRQLKITKYLLLKSNPNFTMTGLSEKLVPGERHGRLIENSVLYFQASLEHMGSFLEQKVFYYFNRENFTGEDGRLQSVYMLSSNAFPNVSDYSLSMDSISKENCNSRNLTKAFRSIDPLASFYNFACEPFSHNFTSKNIIPFDLTTTCPHVSFNASEFNVSETEGNSLVLHGGYKSSLLIPRLNYTLDADRVRICIHTLAALLKKEQAKSSFQKRVLTWQAENILSLICLPVSMMSLLVLFLTYAVFPSLRSLPGKNNMLLVLWIFLAQLQLFLEPFWRPYHRLCVVMGILLHLSWLYAVSWTTVCSFHMCRIFAIRRGVALKNSTSHGFYLSRYIAACSVFSLGLVITVITGSGVSSDWTQVGYGDRGVCYLSSTLLVWLAFFVPLAFSLVLNCALFGLTVWSISRVDEIQRQAGRERRNAHVYMRLSSLTGLCWTLALLAEISDSSILLCLSVIVNGSQGLVLFLSYACNRRVGRLWSGVLSGREGKRLLFKEHGAELRLRKRVGREGSSSRTTGSTYINPNPF